MSSLCSLTLIWAWLYALLKLEIYVEGIGCPGYGLGFRLDKLSVVDVEIVIVTLILVIIVEIMLDEVFLYHLVLSHLAFPPECALICLPLVQLSPCPEVAVIVREPFLLLRSLLGLELGLGRHSAAYELPRVGFALSQVWRVGSLRRMGILLFLAQLVKLVLYMLIDSFINILLDLVRLFLELLCHRLLGFTLGVLESDLLLLPRCLVVPRVASPRGPLVESL